MDEFVEFEVQRGGKPFIIQRNEMVHKERFSGDARNIKMAVMAWLDI